jgi:hypothetical protein
MGAAEGARFFDFLREWLPIPGVKSRSLAALGMTPIFGWRRNVAQKFVGASGSW